MSSARYETEISDHACALVALDLHFPRRGRKDQSRDAKLVCFGCAFREPCLEGALQRNEPWGIWGGMTERERQAERKRRGVAGSWRGVLSATA
jgi:hypothetical protein